MFSLMCGVSGGLSGDREVHRRLLGKGRDGRVHVTKGRYMYGLKYYNGALSNV